ncbi:hypothetical protein GCM10010303_17240 [Streptomyces purpurascens]|nr:hypothetical protein GCM10010303_17240 [Streptomyces purpurascens]
MLAGGRSEVRGHGRQRDVEDRHVEAERQHARDQGTEGPPAARVLPDPVSDSSHEMKVTLKKQVLSICGSGHNENGHGWRAVAVEVGWGIYACWYATSEIPT